MLETGVQRGLGQHDQLTLIDDGDLAAAHQMTEPAGEVTIGGRRLRPTAVFDTYWSFAAARQALYEARLRGAAPPWTSDPILRRHRFTNCYRAADRVSQFLIRRVAYAGPAGTTGCGVPDVAV
jgi:hypothetical protein